MYDLTVILEQYYLNIYCQCVHIIYLYITEFVLDFMGSKYFPGFYLVVFVAFLPQTHLPTSFIEESQKQL